VQVLQLPVTAKKARFYTKGFNASAAASGLVQRKPTCQHYRIICCTYFCHVTRKKDHWHICEPIVQRTLWEKLFGKGSSCSRSPTSKTFLEIEQGLLLSSAGARELEITVGNLKLLLIPFFKVPLKQLCDSFTLIIESCMQVWIPSALKRWTWPAAWSPALPDFFCEGDWSHGKGWLQRQRCLQRKCCRKLSRVCLSFVALLLHTTGSDHQEPCFKVHHLIFTSVQIVCKSHPNIVSCLGFCLDDHNLLPTIAMEFAGNSFAQFGSITFMIYDRSNH